MAFFPSLKQNFIVYLSSEVPSHPDCIFEIHQLWQSGFSRVYFNCFCSCSFETEIIKIGQLSHKIYSNNIVNIQESTTILNARTKKSGNLLKAPHIYIRLTTTTQSRHLALHRHDPCSISEPLKTHSCFISIYRKILTENISILHSFIHKKKKREKKSNKSTKTSNSWSLHKKINKPFWNKINFEYSSHILQWLLGFFPANSSSYLK